MKARTYISTDWIGVHDRGDFYHAKVFLTDNDEAYLVKIQDGKKKIFKVDPNLLKMGELEFFEKFLENTTEITEKEIPFVI